MTELAAPLHLDIVEVLTPPVDYAALEDTMRALQRSTRMHALQRNDG